MSIMERPRLRPGLAAARDHENPNYVLVWDQLRISDRRQRLTLVELEWAQRFDGQRTLREIQAEVMRELGGQLVPVEVIASLVSRLEEALFLDGPRYRERLASPVREPSCIGCYEADPERLREQLSGLFTGHGGPGLPTEPRADGQFRAALVPHIDYTRGGVSFGWGFKEIFERTDASLFVIVGTSHYSAHRFTLTRKHFKSPLGIVETDHAYIDRLVHHYGNGLFDDEVTHIPEHSIELEVVLLQYLYEKRRPIRIVPLLVGSFHDCVQTGTAPGGRSDVKQMIEALRRVEAETTEPICYVISGDLAHIGPKFGDRSPVEDGFLRHSRQRDELLIRYTEAADPLRYFQAIADERDARRICGLPPTYTVLEAVRPSRGKLLHYDQYVHPHGHESVSFASVAFYR